MRSAFLILLAAPAFACAAGSPAAEPVLNEVLYDPAGPDAGAEFVELFNPGTEAADLDGVSVEFANGADGPVWRRRWTGEAGQTIPPGGIFLIGDRGWSGPPGAGDEASLSLQNGPDAVRLVRGSTVLDVLGYGEPLDPELSEGDPHPGADSGCSLSRRPDGADTGDNTADWRGRPPTPGRANFLPWSIGIESRAWDPPSLPAPGQEAVLDLRLVNEGINPLPAGRAALFRDGSAAGEAACWLEELAPEAGRWLRLSWRPAAAGLCSLDLRFPLSDPDTVLCASLGGFQVGPATLYLSEVMAAPGSGACEWVELGNAGPVPLDLDGWSLSDRDGKPSALPSAVVEPGGLPVVAQDPGRHRRWIAGLADEGAPGADELEAAAAAVMEMPGGWPSLNNSPPESRDFADRLELIDPGGTVVDHLTIGPGCTSAPAGRSLERASWLPLGDPASNWGPATSSCGGTPGLANSRAEIAASGPGLSLSPNPFWPEGADGALRLVFALGPRERGWNARVFDLWGHRVRDLGGDDLGPGRRCVPWDGRDDEGWACAPGAYVILLERMDAAGGGASREKALAVIDRGGR